MATNTPAVVEPRLVVDNSDRDLPMLRVITYPTSEEAIAKLAEKFAGLSADTRDGYEEVRIAIGALRTTRSAIEERRQELKRDALDYGKKVDSEAKRLTAAIEAIEEPLKAKKQAVDDEKARQKAAEEQARLDALREEIRRKEEEQAAARRAEEERQAAERKAQQEAEERRLAEERAQLAAERERLDAERRAAAEREAVERRERERIEAEARAQREAEEARLRAEREAIEAERRRLEDARLQAERDEAERQARIRAEREAKERAERERIAAEEARVREAERQAQLQARLDALKPDVEKVAAFVAVLRAITPPAVASIEAREWLNDTMQALQMAADSLEAALDNRESIAARATEESFL